MKGNKMSKNNKNRKIAFIALAVVVSLAAGIAILLILMANSKSESIDSTTPASTSPTKKDSQNATNQTAGVYKSYEASDLSRAENGQVVLFFNAKWCSTCQAANANFLKQQIPENLTIASVDYDKNTALKQKYGVTYQHTFVQVDANGNLIKKWSGSSNIDQLNDQIVK
ncbi:thioredoxin [Patescibacteria group bacterium]|nr:thioredoxin [Patescibacteria group bacterium]